MRAWQSCAIAAGGAPSTCSEAIFVCGLVASLAASPDLVGQSGGVERVEREHHESSISIRIKYAKGTLPVRVPAQRVHM